MENRDIPGFGLTRAIAFVGALLPPLLFGFFDGVPQWIYMALLIVLIAAPLYWLIYSISKKANALIKKNVVLLCVILFVVVVDYYIIMG